VQEVEQAALVWGTTEQVDKGSGEFTGTDTTEAAKPNVWLVLYQQERQHLVSVCKTAITCGIEERRVQLAEAQGEVVVGVIRAILGELGLTPEQAARAPEIASRHLRLVSAQG
jgi:thiamine monophosphate synthase